MAIVNPAAGKLSDRIDPQKIATIGMIIVTVGLTCLYSWIKTHQL